MDLWVVAAAAGCGYLAKFWQNISQERECSSESPSGSSLADNSKSPTFTRQTHETNNGTHSDGMFAKTSQRDGFVPTEVTSSSALEHEIQEDSSISSSSIFPLEFRKHDKSEYREGCTVDSDILESPTWEMGDSHSSERSGNLSRSKHLHLQFIKPHSSLDSCLMAQMYREDAQIQDYLLSPLASPCTPNLRPFLVTSGRQVISRANGNEGYKDIPSNANGEVIGVPSLPKIREANYSKQKLDKGKSQRRKSSCTRTSVQLHSEVSASGQAFFSFGISIGMVFTIIANKLEWEKLKESLKTTEYLVQDLQEELEMKDSLTVKDLVNDDDSQDTYESWCGQRKLNVLSKQVNTTAPMKSDSEESISLIESESMSKIEAELEAELERLELSIKGSTLQERSSDSIEDFDEDITAQLVHGELDAEIIRRRSSSEPTPARGSSSPATPLSAKQGVKPHELSLRLHDVIRSRLEDRITELEGELSRSQRRVQQLESERMVSWREISNTESSSSTLGSPITIEAHSPKATPLIMNLFGDALDAYNEAYYDLDKLNEPQNGSSRIRVETQQRNALSTDQNGFRDCNTTSNGGSPNGCGSGDDVDDLLLIKQIVEKARQGSPAVLRAQRALVYLDKE